MTQTTSTGKPVWQYGERTAQLTFAIPHVGELSLTVHAALPGAGWRQTPEEQKELAMRHAILLVRNLANVLERHRSEMAD
jgi:hypothetical protein